MAVTSTPSFFIMKQFTLMLVLLACLHQATGISFFSQAPWASGQSLAKFPCKIVNATFVDCRNRNLLTVPAGIPKTTQTLLLSHNKIHIFNSTSLTGLVNLRLLNMSHNSLSKLKGEYFADQKQLEHLCLSYNEINKIPSDAFAPLSKLKTLDLSGQNNGLRTAFSEFLLPLNKTLTTLLLEKDMIGSADFGRQLVLKSLKVLSLAANSITGFGSTDLKALAGSQLVTIDLSRNPISNIDTNVFSPLLGVESLYFTHAFAKSPPPLILLANVSAAVSKIQVQKLILSSLGLKSLDSSMFEGLRNSTLQELDLSFNNIAELGDKSFGSELTHLKVLQLYRNNITTISQKALSGLTSLVTLDMESNVLMAINPGTFEHNTPLQKLYLSNNSIAKLSESGSFKGLINLEVLSLSKNRISQTFSGDEFQDLGELVNLDLSESKLKSGPIFLSPSSFKSLSKLKYLNLKKVGLQNIVMVPSPFAPLLELRFLDVSNNNMDSLHPDTFVSLKSLETLYLDHNHFNNMWHPPQPHQSPCMFLRKLVSLVRLDLSSNGFQSVPVGAFKDLAHLRTLHLSNNQLSAISGHVFEDLKELEYLDLHKNLINVVNETMLTPILKTLKILYICGNPFSCGCQQEWFRNWIDQTKVVIGNRSMCLCDSPPDMRGKPLMSFHPEDLNCDGKLPLRDWIGIGVGSFVFLLVVVNVIVHRWKFYYIYLLVRASHRRSKRNRDYEKLFDYDAFISYSSDDEEWVTATLIPQLENGKEQFKVCHHGRDFKPGKDIVDNIIESVDCSRRTICVISQKYLESNWCTYERRVTMSKLFISYKDVLILIILEDIPDKMMSKYDLIHRAVKKKTYLKWPTAESGSEDERAVFWLRLKTVLSEDRTPENNEIVI